jgi:hypothetical protein
MCTFVWALQRALNPIEHFLHLQGPPHRTFWAPLVLASIVAIPISGPKKWPSECICPHQIITPRAI